MFFMVRYTKKVNKMTKVYQNYSTGDETRLEPRTEGSTFLITSAQILPYLYEGEDVLRLSIKENMGDTSFGYGLFGNEIKNEFMSDMKVGNVEELVGRFVVGFVHENKKFLEGLGILHKQFRGFSQN
jgi:hypothetical protein